MDMSILRELALHAIKGTAPANYAVEDVDAAFSGELSKYCGSVNQFLKNQYDIFEILVEAVDTIVPNNVIRTLQIFAEFKQVKQGQKAIFKKTVGKNRARKFLTQVGLSGVYETFRLDKTTYEVTPMAVGGAATIDFERLLDGEEVLSEVMEIITEGMTDAVFGEIQKALKACLTATGRPAANTVIENKFDGNKMFKLCSVVKAYGGGNCVIFAPPEFVAEMGADAIVPVGANYPGIYHPDDIDAIHKTGYINLFRGTPIVQIPQSFIDESNTTTWIDPQLAYILPAGRTKVVKCVFEGDTQMHSFINRDNSIEVDAYKKFGVAIESQHNWGIYQNTGITQTLDSPYGV